ncbi:MAG: DUF4175 domain-containing protein [Flavobacteriales bacterium]|nr:DUF4175 domain-containing protein [Flavobacteriales bacterium]MBK7554712.1 DUF4175 domain-containing protein [Flavobacteriales bacterium]MBK9193505.1 DUF4175 domain-containing protein [Flavobacteriales bacterium]
MKNSDYALLIEKLDAFTRKYYKDRLIRGVLYSVGLVVVFFLVVALLEHVGHFSSGARTALLWSYIAVAAAIIARFIVWPLVKLFHLGKVISHNEAANIVGKHFGEVKDKLLNTLQLKELSNSDNDRREWIEASIAQRSRELSPVPFSSAIDLSKNTRYLRYALPPLAVLVLLLFGAPSFSDSTLRLMQPGKEFIPEAPFRFVLKNTDLTVPETEDYELELALEGDVIPQRVEVEVDGNVIPMVRKEGNTFAHRFRNVQQAIDFNFTADGFDSPGYTLSTTANPLLLDFGLSFDYPAYLGLKDETMMNAGDATVPAGTRITWNVNTRSAQRLELAFDDTTYSIEPAGADHFSAERRFFQSRTYTMAPKANTSTSKQPLQYRVEVVPDLYPLIAVDEQVDSTAPKRLYFRGEIGDDHGFKRLLFHYRFLAGGDSTAVEDLERTVELNVAPTNTRQEFFHLWDMYMFNIAAGDKIEYYFEVWDNDGVTGSKSARSQAKVWEAPTLKELAEDQSAQADAIKQSLQQNIREAQDIQRDLDKLRREMLDKKELEWQDKQKLENVLDRQKQLQQNIERTTEQLRQSQQQRQEFSPMDERMMEKQQQIQELFENVLTEEMKELYRQVQEMMEKLDKKELQEQVQEMKLSQEDIEKELDRSLELFKQMEVEQKAQDIADQLEKLAEEQKKLSEESKQNEAAKDEQKQEEMKAKQDSLNKAFEEIEEQMKDLEEKNKELEQPKEMPDTKSAEEEVKKEQQESKEELEKKENKKASESQKDAAEQMEQMAFQMESMAGGAAPEQQEEDMDALRQLLENIVELSQDQEAVMGDLGSTKPRDPHLVDIGREQKKLRDDAKIIEDSLFALSKRVAQLESTINREMNAVNENMDLATELIGNSRANDRDKPMAAEKQQRAMTSLNNLALLLDEALQQMMQQQNSSKMPGSGTCNKPGGKGQGKGKKPSASKMKAQQEALNKQLEEMRKGQQKGKKPGEKNEGGSGQPGMSQQLASMAAQQAAIRKEMQRLAQELNKDGSGAGNPLGDLAKEMEQTEKDIVNKKITQETIERQKDIMTRLLEHEKAEREREQDEKRQSSEGRDLSPEDPARFFEYQRRKEREAELLRTMPPGLKPYYKQKVNAYFGSFGRP